MNLKRNSIAFLIISGVISLSILIAIFLPEKRVIGKISEEERLQAYLLLLNDLPEQAGDYYEYNRLYNQARFENQDSRDPIALFDADSGENSLRISGEPLKFSFSVPHEGPYAPRLTWRRTDMGLNNFTMEMRIDGDIPFSEANALELPRIWSDASKEFRRDRYNDESLPLQIPSDQWTTTGLYDGPGRIVAPISLYLEPGEHNLSFKGINGGDVELKSLELVPFSGLPSYEEYREVLTAAEKSASASGQNIEINAISYIGKNAYDVRMGSEINPSVTPYHRVDKLLNVINSQSWDRSGEEVEYAFSVPEEGNYRITLHYNNPKSDFAVFRTVKVDGEIPFSQLAPYRFDATGAGSWENETLSDREGIPFLFHLTEGEHKISLKAEKEPVSRAIRSLKTINAHMTYFGIEIMKVAGRDIDEYRTWRLTDYIPQAADYLEAYRILISDIITDLADYSQKGQESSMTTSLHTALFKIDLLAEKPDELPIHLKEIYSTSIYDRPITQILGDTINLLENCEMGLDALYIDSKAEEREANAPWPRKVASSISSLAATFSSEKYVTRNEEDSLNIWVTRPVTHTDIMQKMADADFTARTGVKVKISVMPDPNRLILATAADRTPDIAMGLPSFIPFDLAIRGAAMNLTDFDDFWTFASDFSPGAFIPYIINENVYAFPETLDFHALVYRTDIFRQLGMTPPDTWQDVIELLPVLQRYGMNFYHPIAGGLPTLKWFYQTSPFVYQFGGSLYNSDGLSVSLDNPKTVEGLRFLSDLFSIYAMQEQVPVFYNSFRFGVVPVGIVDSLSYLQMKYAAPELKGQWALAPYPGIPDDNGDPQRWFIANGVSALVMKDTKMPEESWEFMKWWLSEETQVDFGYRLQSTYGPEFLWISANLRALENSPIEEADKEVILQQVRWQRDVPRTPAQYMLERGLSDIWINSATKNKSSRTEIDKMIPVINREVTRKMIEFGFIDTEGNALKPFIVPQVQWVKDQIASAEEEPANE